MLSTQKIFTLTSVAMLLLVACSPTPTPALIAVPNNSTEIVNPPPATAVPPVIIQASPTTFSLSTQTTEPAPAQLLFLQILSPQDEDTVNTSQVDVIGSAPAGATVSVNDDVLIVGADQQFESMVTLDEGPNLIEIIVSDDSGNETSLELTVIYEP